MWFFHLLAAVSAPKSASINSVFHVLFIYPWHKTKERTKAIFNTLQHTLEMHDCTLVYGLPKSLLVVLKCAMPAFCSVRTIRKRNAAHRIAFWFGAWAEIVWSGGHYWQQLGCNDAEDLEWMFSSGHEHWATTHTDSHGQCSGCIYLYGSIAFRQHFLNQTMDIDNWFINKNVTWQ